jgi:sulfur carrier protein
VVEFELNGASERAEAGLSVKELLARFGLAGRRVAVAINTEVVPRSRYELVRIREGDRVEVIQAVGGG